MVEDWADIGLSTKLDLDEREAFDRHDEDKLGKASTKDLIRSKNKRVVNPLPSGLALMNLATEVAKYFSYGTRINNLHKICEIKDSPTIKQESNKKGTHAAAHHRLMESLVCLNKGLHIYQV